MMVIFLFFRKHSFTLVRDSRNTIQYHTTQTITKPRKDAMF